MLGLSVSPNVFLGLSLFVIGADSLSEAHPLALGGTTVYSLDVLLGIVLLRAVLPRDRLRSLALLGEMTRFLFAILALVLVIAAVRPVLAGYSFISVIRLATPLFYSFGFYFGLGRVIRERGFDLDRTLRYLLAVALGLVAYMAIARIANTPFEDETNPNIGHLGTVNTTTARSDGTSGSPARSSSIPSSRSQPPPTCCTARGARARRGRALHRSSCDAADADPKRDLRPRHRAGSDCRHANTGCNQACQSTRGGRLGSRRVDGRRSRPLGGQPADSARRGRALAPGHRPAGATLRTRPRSTARTQSGRVCMPRAATRLASGSSPSSTRQ